MGTYIRSLLFSKCAYKILVEKSHPSSVRLLSYLTNDRSLRWTSRTHWCGKLTVENIGEHVQLAGWVQYSRLDNKFILIRDATGIIQLLIPEEGKIAHDVKEILMKIGPESSINATGKVVGRPTGQSNPNMDTGSIEIELESVDFVNPAIKSLPFLPSRDTNEGKEPLRMKYRSLDLRRQNLQNNLRVRSKVIMDMRKFLCDHGFVDIETPTLFRRTPGGAREFIVPTRLRGKFYSLVQSPQQFKQMLMVGGFDKYFQVARCYRDEGSKPNRQPEFTQLDIEMAWCDRQGIQQCIEELLLNVLPNIVDSKSSSKTGERSLFARKTYRECIERYGTDKPDLRFGNEIQDWTDHFQNNALDDFSNHIKLSRCCVKGIVFHQNGTDMSVAELKRLEKQTLARTRFLSGSDTLLVSNFKVDATGDIRCSLIKKNFPKLVNSLGTKVDLRPDDIGFIVIGTNVHDSASICAGTLRTELSNLLYTPDPSEYQFLWVEDFPLFLPKENDDNNKIKKLEIESAHHPFTQPHPDDMRLLELSDNESTLSFEKLLKVRSLHYDLVLNGQEIGGGSVRISDPGLQKFIIQDILSEDISELTALLESLSFGCPPHGGIALGLDRLLAILCNASSIRDVIAFPKGGDGKDLMSGAPSSVHKEQLEEYHINVINDSNDCHI